MVELFHRGRTDGSCHFVYIFCLLCYRFGSLNLPVESSLTTLNYAPVVSRQGSTGNEHYKCASTSYSRQKTPMSMVENASHC
eukprot:3605417-Amphidinium_carterae.1